MDINTSRLNQSNRIVMCPPYWEYFEAAMRGEPSDATHLIQSTIATRLQERGHKLVMLGTRKSGEVVFGSNLGLVKSAPRTWSRKMGFIWATKATWRIQQHLGIPYLNYYSNLSLYDACLRVFQTQDLIFERNTLFRDGIARASRRLRLPYVLYIEADEILESDIMGTPWSGLLKWRAIGTTRYNLHTADAVICVSEQLKNHLIAHWRVPVAKLHVFHNAADIDKFRPDADIRYKVRSALGLTIEPLIVFVGNFYIWHDVATLIRAFAKVSDIWPTAYLLLVGDGASRETMIRLAAELGISKRVNFTGLVPQDKVPGFMAASDIAVAPYPQLPIENWLSPLKLYEYMAAGLAIVASSSGQIPEVIEDGRNGILVPPGDSDAMHLALQRLLDDLPLRERLANQARNDAILRHSWAKYVDRLEDIFYDVIVENQAMRHSASTKNR